ncbi:MAG: peptidoglycan DD-metalloendopeptidase family protein [Rhizobiaceae bacterium]|nr:peptidoglycan DD-metalloendopeptidase family protein [Rhizobiaceae bacterium]
MKQTGQPSAVFGKRKEPHTVIIARGNKVRHFTVKPWLAATITGIVTTLAVGYLAATTYLVFRDDIISAVSARQTRAQQAYEDRIAALRAQLDRVTSRQLLDQQLVETKVSELLSRQAALIELHGHINLSDQPEPAPSPDTPSIATPLEIKPQAALEPQALYRSLQSIETDQLRKLDAIESSAYQGVSELGEALRVAGIDVEDAYGKADVGGPLVPMEQSSLFDMRIKDVDKTLERLGDLKRMALEIPFINPAPTRSVSSQFGVRTDPLLGTPAMHSGIDFRAPSGAPVVATAYGVVSEAGWNGGYGKMVEVKHTNGFTTRFAHLSAISVNIGDKVKPGDVLGAVGSTGRSTGPHIHYEIRQNGLAVNPAKFLRAGEGIERHLASF